MTKKKAPDEKVPKGYQLVFYWPEVSWDKEEGCFKLYPNWGGVGCRVYKNGLRYIYKWVLSLGWVQIRAWQDKTYEELSLGIFTPKKKDK